MTITGDQLRTWSEQLCTLPPVDFTAALAALGIAGSLVVKTSDYSIVEPPPAGASRIGLMRGDNQGKLSSLEVMLDGKALTHAELDRRFGAGQPLPRVDYNRPYVVAYRVEVAGAPFSCAVLASFAEQPTAASVVTKVTLRRDAVGPDPDR